MMKAVKQANPRAEIEVREVVTALGGRRRLENRDLPEFPRPRKSNEAMGGRRVAGSVWTSWFLADSFFSRLIEASL